MMLGMFLVLLLANICAGFYIEGQETYPGFTVFDDKHGNYFRVIGPTFFKVEHVLISRPPYNFTGTFKIYFELTPSIFIYNIFLNGTVKYNNKPLWIYDGVSDHCVEGNPGFVCPMKKNKKILIQGEYNISEAGMIPGRYTLAVNGFTKLPGGKHLHLMGIESGVVVIN